MVGVPRLFSNRYGFWTVVVITTVEKLSRRRKRFVRRHVEQFAVPMECLRRRLPGSRDLTVQRVLYREFVLPKRSIETNNKEGG